MFESSKAQLEGAKRVLHSRFHPFPKVAVVLGSGFGKLFANQSISQELSFFEIPGFQQTSVDGHSGVLGMSKLEGKNLLWMSGRPHFYEGLSWNEVLFPFRALAYAGVETFVLTNAAGALNPSYQLGNLVLIEDHIFAMGLNPLRGPHEAFLGERFVDLSKTYDLELRKQLMEEAQKAGVTIHQGVYLAACGPTYETPAEAKLYRSWGADVVGMSTVPEAIALKQMNKRILAISCVSNTSASTGNHHEVLQKIEESLESFWKPLASFLLKMK